MGTPEALFPFTVTQISSISCKRYTHWKFHYPLNETRKLLSFRRGHSSTIHLLITPK